MIYYYCLLIDLLLFCEQVKHNVIEMIKVIIIVNDSIISIIILIIIVSLYHIHCNTWCITK